VAHTRAGIYHHPPPPARRLEALLTKINSPSLSVSTTAAAAVWGLATTGWCRRCFAELDAMSVLLGAINKTLTMQVRQAAQLEG